MSEHETTPVIVIKRVTKKHGGHHGGGWKIAYADFVTAMMAFFLLLWLLSLMDQNKLQGISNYFKKPLRDIFVENAKNDTNIPKVPETPTLKNELSPLRMVTEKMAQESFNADTENVASSENIIVDATQLKVVNTKDKNPNKEQMPRKDSFDTDGNPENAEKEELKSLKKQLTDAINNNPGLKDYKNHLDFEVVADGLKIVIKSLEGRPMFSDGDFDFQRYARGIITWLAKELNKSPRKITIIGHTDGMSFSSKDGYSNWELSTQRANATRSLLLKKGMHHDKIIRVQGAGNMNLLDKYDSENPINRRIEIILLTKEATEKYLNQ